MLDYDQVLEEIVLSTGNPKNTDDLEHTVFLNYENNKVSDTINIETKDFVKASIKVSYCVNFETEYKNRWFDVENYVKYLCDRMRSLVKRMAKNYNIEEFYQNYSELVRNVAIDYDPNAEKTDSSKSGRFFPENGMRVTDCEVLAINVEREIAKLLNEHQYDMVQKSLELTNAEKRVKVAEKLAEAEQKEQELRSQSLINEMNLKREEAVRKLEIQTEINRQTEAEKLAAKQAEQDMQPILDAIHEAGLARTDRENQQEIAHEKQVADIEKAKQEAYAATVAKIMGSISPDLIASMTSSSNAELITALSESVAPYAIAQNESISTVVNKMTRGLPIEDILKNPSMGVSEE
jgi:major vault protein